MGIVTVAGEGGSDPGEPGVNESVTVRAGETAAELATLIGAEVLVASERLGILTPAESTNDNVTAGVDPPGVAPPGVDPPGVDPPGVDPPGVDPPTTVNVDISLWVL